MCVCVCVYIYIVLFAIYINKEFPVSLTERIYLR